MSYTIANYKDFETILTLDCSVRRLLVMFVPAIRVHHTNNKSWQRALIYHTGHRLIHDPKEEIEAKNFLIEVK